MYNKLEIIWKEVAVAERKYYPGICMERLRKITDTSATIADVSVEVRTKHLQKRIILQDI
jgi:hypothetical protein